MCAHAPSSSQQVTAFNKHRNIQRERERRRRVGREVRTAMSRSKGTEFLGMPPLEVGCHPAPGHSQVVASITRANQTTRKSFFGWSILMNVMILWNFPVLNTHEVWNPFHSSHIRGNYVNLDFIYVLFWLTNISRFLQDKTFQNTHWETWALPPCPSILPQRLMGNHLDFPTTYFFDFLPTVYFEKF